MTHRGAFLYHPSAISGRNLPHKPERNRKNILTPIRLPVTTPPIVAENADTYVAKYVPLGCGIANPDEIETRRIARELKIPTDAAIHIAAPEMAALIDGPCWLVPVPASDGSLAANLALARDIARFVSGARVKCAIGRLHPVEPSRNRRLRGLPRLTIEEHSIIRTAPPIQLLPLYFVDNVITTGTTNAACRRAIGWGTGLAYADASTA